MTTSKPRTLMPLFDELRGERVVVRPYRPEDAAALQEAVAESREHVRPWLPFADAHQTVNESRDWILHCMAKWLLREDMVTSLWDAETGRYIGGSGLHPRDWEVGHFEIGYWLRASAEGKGYMTEAVKIETDFAFAHLGANRVMIRCDARNTRSAAVPRRAPRLRRGSAPAPRFARNRRHAARHADLLADLQRSALAELERVRDSMWMGGKIRAITAISELAVLHEPACELQSANRGIGVNMIRVGLESATQRDEPHDFVCAKITYQHAGFGDVGRDALLVWIHSWASLSLKL